MHLYNQIKAQNINFPNNVGNQNVCVCVYTYKVQHKQHPFLLHKNILLQNHKHVLVIL